MHHSFKLSPKTSFTLDLIRWISAQMVLVGHALNYFNVFPFLKPPAFIVMQNAGVVIFFLLSGLLISHSTFSKLDRQDYTFRHFFIDRFSRIFTGFIPCLILVLLIDLCSIYVFRNDYPYYENFDPKTFFGNLLMLQDFPLFTELAAKVAHKAGLPPDVDITISSFGSARPFWTLAIEWWFYMAFGWMVLVGKSTVKSKILRYGILLLLAIVPVYNLVNGRGNGLTMMWAMGVVITLLLQRYTPRSDQKKLFFVFAVVLSGLALGRALFNQFRGFQYVEYDLVFAATLGAALIALIYHCQQTELKASPFLAKANKFLADYSFTLYLMHHSILDLMARSFPGLSHYVNFFLSLLVANLFCGVFAYFTEMRYKEVARFLKGRIFQQQFTTKELT